MQTNIGLIRFFKKVVKEEKTLSFDVVNGIALKMGYIVTPGACNESVMKFLESSKINYNSTFYKTFEDVTSKNRIELFFDQVFHYATTYGTDFSMGNGYVPNDGEIVLTQQDFETYKVIDCCTEKEMFELCMNLLCSNIALSSNTVKDVVDFIDDYTVDMDDEEFGQIEDRLMEEVTNREAIVAICDRFGCLPKRKFDLLRYIVYKTTGDMVLIQNEETIMKIMYPYGEDAFNFSILTEEEMRSLASIYRRFKKIFCAFKHSHNSKVNNAPYINKLNRLAKKYHTPMVKGFWESLIETRPAIEEVRERFHEVSTFKLIQLYNCISNNTEYEKEGTKKPYIIRNGKVFVKEVSETKEPISEKGYYLLLGGELYSEILRRTREKLEKKGYTHVKYNPHLMLGCPTSEKNFVGELPFGSSVKMEKDNYVGIYWRNEWGTRDFDLHVLDERMRRYGWCSRYGNSDNTVIYSGDMTNADPEATEIFYFSKDCPNCIISVNRYYGQNGSKLRFFVGSQKIEKLHRNYMVNPDSIHLENDMESTSGEQTLGVICNGYYYATVLGSNEGIVPRSNERRRDLFLSVAAKAKSMLKLKPILSEILIDMDILNEEDREKIEKEKILDLTQLNKNTLIELFS